MYVSFPVFKTAEPIGDFSDYIDESTFKVMDMQPKYDVTPYVDRLYTAALKKAGDSYVAEDLVQETFLAALCSLEKGTQPKQIESWLYRILSNKYCDWLRDKYGKPVISFEEYPVVIENEPLDEDSEETLEAIRRELGYLAKTHREVMVRFYMHGESVEDIARALRIPSGTVKSRLSTGRQHVKKGVVHMENYTKQSYEPDTLQLSCSGGIGLNNEPFSLVDPADSLTQNILILAYPKPVTETELAKALGVPVVFVEPIVEKMIRGELMRRTDGGKVYTDFIIYTEKDRKATFDQQLEIVDKHFERFWNETQQALATLREKDYYQRQTPHGRAKLELYFAIKLLLQAQIDIRNEVTGVVPYEEYPYRKNGGRWLAMGHQYPSGYRYEHDREFFKCSISGEASTRIQNFKGTPCLEMRKYDTALGRYPDDCFKADYVRWLYELILGVPREDSAVGDFVFQEADRLVESGVLIQEDGLKVDIPILSRAEYLDECSLVSAHEETLSRTIHYVHLPPHLTSVCKWQPYMYCGDRVPMAVIHKAMEKGLFLSGIGHPIPASIFIVEK